jgi:hypothetical protein
MVAGGNQGQKKGRGIMYGVMNSTLRKAPETDPVPFPAPRLVLAEATGSKRFEFPNFLDRGVK